VRSGPGGFQSLRQVVEESSDILYLLMQRVGFQDASRAARLLLRMDAEVQTKYG